MKLEIMESSEVLDDAMILYPWLPDVLPFNPENGGLLQVLAVEKTDMAVYCRLGEAPDRYGLREFAVVDRRGKVQMRLRIAEVPVIKQSLMKMIFRGNRPVYRDDISEILDWARYFVFYNSKDPAIAILWELED